MGQRLNQAGVQEKALKSPRPSRVEKNAGPKKEDKGNMGKMGIQNFKV
jgi:hypothetical protein